MNEENITMKNTKTIAWTKLKVHIDDCTYKIIPLEGIYEMKLENTSGDIHKMLKQDLIEGNDRFLIATFDYTDKGFSFEMFYSFDEFDMKEFIDYEYQLANFVLGNRIKKPTIVTIK